MGMGVECEAIGTAVENGIADGDGEQFGDEEEWCVTLGDKVERLIGDFVAECLGAEVECEIGLMDDEKLMGGMGEGEVG